MKYQFETEYKIDRCFEKCPLGYFDMDTGNFYCRKYDEEVYNFNTRPDWCPLIEIEDEQKPKHEITDEEKRELELALKYGFKYLIKTRNIVFTVMKPEFDCRYDMWKVPGDSTNAANSFNGIDINDVTVLKIIDILEEHKNAL